MLDVLVTVLEDLQAIPIIGFKTLEDHLREDHASLQGLGVGERLGVQDNLHPLLLKIISGDEHLLRRVPLATYLLIDAHELLKCLLADSVVDIHSLSERVNVVLLGAIEISDFDFELQALQVAQVLLEVVSPERLQAIPFVLLVPVFKFIAVLECLLLVLIFHQVLAALLSVLLDEFKVFVHVSLDGLDLLLISLSLVDRLLILQRGQYYLLDSFDDFLGLLCWLSLVVTQLVFKLEISHGVLCLPKYDVNLQSHQLLHKDEVREVRDLHAMGRDGVVVVAIEEFLLLFVFLELEGEVGSSEDLLTLVEGFDHIVVVHGKL